MFLLSISGTFIARKPFMTALLQAGWPVVDLNAGADAAGTRTLLFMPRDLMESERLLFETEAWAKTLPELETIILCADLSPRYVRALRGRIGKHITLVDAPLVGAYRLAEGEKGTFFLGGPGPALDRLDPLFGLLGRKSTRMGEFGTAMAAKALQDCLAAASSAITRSALDWAEAQGIEEDRLLPFLEATFGPKLSDAITDPAVLVQNALPGDNAGEALVRRVESALGTALRGVHLTPPRSFGVAQEAPRTRHLH